MPNPNMIGSHIKVPSQVLTSSWYNPFYSYSFYFMLFYWHPDFTYVSIRFKTSHHFIVLRGVLTVVFHNHSLKILRCYYSQKNTSVKWEEWFFTPMFCIHKNKIQNERRQSKRSKKETKARQKEDGILRWKFRFWFQCR